MDELQALNEVLYAHLSNAGVWGDRAYPLGTAPTRTERPYLLWFWAGGGAEYLGVGTDNARITLTMKCVADQMGDALTGKAQVEALLKDAGVQDIDPRLPSQAEWQVSTVSIDRAVVIDEFFEQAVPLYHRGNQYVFAMERIS